MSSVARYSIHQRYCGRLCPRRSRTWSESRAPEPAEGRSVASRVQEGLSLVGIEPFHHLEGLVQGQGVDLLGFDPVEGQRPDDRPKDAQLGLVLRAEGRRDAGP